MLAEVKTDWNRLSFRSNGIGSDADSKHCPSDSVLFKAWQGSIHVETWVVRERVLKIHSASCLPEVRSILLACLLAV